MNGRRREVTTLQIFEILNKNDFRTFDRRSRDSRSAMYCSVTRAFGRSLAALAAWRGIGVH